MRELSKLGYSSTFEGYKWVIKYKHSKIKCGSLVLQVYTHVLMKVASKQVSKTWSIKRNINKYDHFVNAHVLDNDIHNR